MLHEGDLEEEKVKQLKLVLATLSPYCNGDSEFEDFRKIAKIVAEGKELVGEHLEGSTNFSYRVFPKDNPGASIFVKIGFEYARWNPKKSFYDLNRIQIEYQMLKRFADLLGPLAPVATPYLCVDVTPKSKMLVAQWAPQHEVWAHQFVRGKIDLRVMTQLARFIAEVNTQSIHDIHLNDGIKDSFRGLYPIAKGIFANITSVEGDSADHFVAYARELGQVRFDEIIDGLATAYDRSDVLLHGDTHAINILVEPSVAGGGFGKKGEFYVCDWEMVHVGDKGRDPGTFFAWPILCSYFLAARGETLSAFDVVNAMKQFWDVYSCSLVEKDSIYKNDLSTVLRSCLGWCGVYAFVANYVVGVQRTYMPFHLVRKEASDLCLASVAVTGVKCMERGFLNTDSSLSTEELWEWFESLIKEHIALIEKLCPPQARSGKDPDKARK